MSFNLRSLQTEADTETDGFNSSSFKVVIESHLTYLRNLSSTSSIPMDGLEHIVFRGSLDGWLFQHHIKERYHWTIARINGFSSCSDYDGTKRVFLIPDLNGLDKLLQIHKSS